MGTKTVKAIELILDWNLWPRHDAHGLDSTNVTRMREALKAGVTLPPVIVNASDMRVIDGFHRTRAHLQEFGDDAKMRVDMRVYESDADMFADSIRYNAINGLPLSPKDRAHAILKARKFKIPMSAIAMALGMSEAGMKEFLAKRTATNPDGEKIALSYGASGLAGKQLTEEDMPFVDTAGGCLAGMYASMLINALRAPSLALSEKTIERLKELRDLIDRVLV